MTKLNTAYCFTNDKGFTSYVYVCDLSEKSVFYYRADESGQHNFGIKFRVSRKTFGKYKELF